MAELTMGRNYFRANHGRVTEEALVLPEINADLFENKIDFNEKPWRHGLRSIEFTRKYRSNPPPVLYHIYFGPDVPKTLPKTTPILEPDVPKNLPKPNIPYPSRLNQEKSRDKASNQKEKIFQMFQDLRFDISFADALLLMPRFAPTIKSLLMNKEKLLGLAKIPLNENCSAMLLRKLPGKNNTWRSRQVFLFHVYFSEN
ncbi:hypothetical protein Tco_0184864 [Tanacetum coccineum]